MAAAYDEPYRPQFHFSPARHWMNDPNGLVHHAGEYHLFFQHNPFGATWANMSWGHAVSRDLVRWEPLPLAIPGEGDEAVYSGSVVVDRENRSGFGSGGRTPMVAVYTSAHPGGQVQSLAYSLDRGRTWTKYAGNPVLEDAEREFRDPKVLRHGDGWVMAVAKAQRRTVAFYRSDDLRSWRHLSDFEPGGDPGEVWECPDLFPLRSGGVERWVLLVSVDPRGPGAGMRYFVGDFDGTRFTADGDWAPLDAGADLYAGVTFDEAPGGRRIMLGWMSSWRYAGEVPTAPWRGAMSVPRELALREAGGRTRLVQRPVPELERLAGEAGYDARAVRVPGGRHDLPGDGACGSALVIDAVLAPGTAARAGIEVRGGDDEATAIGYDAAAGELYVDRTGSGEASFSPQFAEVHRAPLALRDGRVRLRALVDRSSVEVFADDGLVTITDQVFPRAASDRVRLFAEGGDATLARLRIRPMHSAWRS